MSKSYIPYLQHILEECRYVRSVVPDDAKMYECLVVRMWLWRWGTRTHLMHAHHVESDDSVKHGLLDNRGCKQGWSDGQLIIRAIIHLPWILSFRRPV